MIVAVDPSVRSPGVAIAHNDEIVYAARVVVGPGPRTETRGARVRRGARQIVALACEIVPPSRAAFPITAVYEWPQVYRASKSKGDPNDLIALAAIGALVAEMLGAADDLTPTPAEWIGNLPKTTTGDPWASPRARRIASVLSPAERARVPASHDAIDAVGLALWAAGRLERRRVLPGAT